MKLTQSVSLSHTHIYTHNLYNLEKKKSFLFPPVQAFESVHKAMFLIAVVTE